MQLPVEISYRGVEMTKEIEAYVQEKVARLEKFCDHMTRCDVIIEQPNHSVHSGSPFRVRIDVTVPPQHELVVDEKPTKHEMHDTLHKVITTAFKGMERQLKELTDRQHNKVKHHESGPSAFDSAAEVAGLDDTGSSSAYAH